MSEWHLFDELLYGRDPFDMKRRSIRWRVVRIDREERELGLERMSNPKQTTTMRMDDARCFRMERGVSYPDLDLEC